MVLADAAGTGHLICDAVADDEACRAMLGAVLRGAIAHGQHCTIDARPIGPAALDSTAAPVDVVRLPGVHSNSAIALGGRFLLKLFRRIEPGINPDVEVGQYLARTGAHVNTPALIGTIEHRSKDGTPATLALVQELVASRTNAWEYTLDELAGFFATVQERHTAPVPADVRALARRSIDSLALLGRRTAELHRALAGGNHDPDFVPEHSTSGEIESLARRIAAQAAATLDLLAERSGSFDREAQALASRVLEHRTGLMERLEGLGREIAPFVRIRIHGDYHLGQVLCVDDDFVIIDFEGEPTRPLTERRSKQSPLRDVAGMLRSIGYAAHAGLKAATQGNRRAQLEPWARAWEGATAEAFLQEYLAVTSDATFLPSDPGQVDCALELFVLQKALYELDYEMNNRPGWVGAPLDGILALAGGEHGVGCDLRGSCPGMAPAPASVLAPGPWRPALGAWPDEAGAHFRVWAPGHERVDVVLAPGRPDSRTFALRRGEDGTFAGTTSAAAGARYAYLLDGAGPFPDPASRFQPDGVHGPSAIVDPRAFIWTDQTWHGVPLSELTIYEAHVGTFTPEGTFAGTTARLPHLRDLGVTAIELMPVAEFPGMRNWGYDGVAPFAPSRAYGTPDDLRRLVDTAHRLGLAVLLDVVYNHFGPDGAYFSQFSPYYFSSRHHTPWGQAINLDGEQSEHVRAFFFENALHWIREYHVDGLRLDATHALIDEGPRHFLGELRTRVRAASPDRPVLLIAEDDRNLAIIVRPPEHGGWGLDAVWADDFHHQMRRLTAGDADGYFQDFSGTTEDVAATLERGWFFSGQHSAYRRATRGTDPSGIARERMVIALQNHDQIGNRAFGERLHHQIDPAVFRAASALLVMAPETPLLFMGQEWAAGTPFQYFTDHHDELGRLVTEGRRNEFSRFAAFADERSRARIPDPQARATFERCRLDWTEPAREPHAGTLRLYRALLDLRRAAPAERVEVTALDSQTIALLRASASREALLLVARLGASGAVDLDSWNSLAVRREWRVVLTTEDATYTESPQPADVDLTRSAPRLGFRRPAAVILEGV
jgi:maltooligosyltrehalose trehalohydrolase